MARSFYIVLLLAGASVAADTEIHRCTQDDGTVSFQEMPCAESAASADSANRPDESDGDSPVAADDPFDFVNPFDEPADPPTPPEPARPLPVSGDRAECEKTTRVAIDAIDLEMRQTTYSKEQGREYLAELLVLTRQLRACKKL